VLFTAVAPLSLYLLSFVAAFSRVSTAVTDIAVRLLPMQALLVAVLTIGRLAIRLGLAVPLHLLLFTESAAVCHRRPARAGVEDLTGYYLAIAFGGMLGGAWNALDQLSFRLRRALHDHGRRRPARTDSPALLTGGSSKRSTIGLGKAS
jgi:hypothetical protein